MLRLLSIQSSVAYGHVGNSAAVFPLQRLGVEVWPVLTVHFSNHTGYGNWRGPVLGADSIRDVLQGVEERGVFPQCDGVLSGYLGEESIGEVVLEAVARVKRANPNAVYCCDPVMGDVDSGFFVREGIPEFMRERGVPAAALVTPNQFELDYLSGQKTTDLASALTAVRKVQALGPKIVLVTSLRLSNTREEVISMLACDREQAFLIQTPLLPLVVNGAGDATAALFFAHWLRTGSIRFALEQTASSIFGLLRVTVQAGAHEVQLVAAQEEFVHPSQRFQAVEVEWD
jgi:pyridoxine kinase